MKVYKLQHIPTGLFFTPSRGNGNLSKSGKIYNKPPSIEWATRLRIKIFSFKKEPRGHHKLIVDHFRLNWKNGYIDEYVKTSENDWKIIEL